MQAARGASLSSSDLSPEARIQRRRTSRIIFWSIAASLFLIDQGSKHLALTHLTEHETKPLVGDLFGLRLVFNPGAAFSLGTSMTELLTAFACLAAIVVVVLSMRVASTFWAIGFGFLLAGITGNLFDRLFREPGFFRGHVVDMFALPDFPVFNVADVCINVAAGVIIIQAIRGIALDGSRHDSVDEAAESKDAGSPSVENKPSDANETSETTEREGGDPA